MNTVSESKFPAALWSEFGHSIIRNLELKKTAQGAVSYTHLTLPTKRIV